MTESKEVKIFENAESVAAALAFEFYQIVTSSRQRFDIALSGGNTPKILFETLARDYRKKIPWKRIHFWWADERCVLPTDEESNYRMTKEHLFSKIDIDESQVHRIQGEIDPESAAEDYIKQIQAQLNERNEWPIFDLIILGIGSDGHTASIFPHEKKLLQSDKVCAVAKHPETGQKRITLTGKVLNNANRVFFMVTGKPKAKRISEIMNNLKKANQLPAFHIEPKLGEITFFLDKKAASKIS